MRHVLASLLLLAVSVVSTRADSLDTLTLEQAIEIGLRNNFDIRIARNEARIAQNNKGFGTAGFLPTLDLSGNVIRSESDQTTNSPFSFGDSETEQYGASISLNWTVFDGFRMFVEKKRYDALARLGEYRARNTIEQRVVDISRAYFNLVQQQQILRVAEDTREVSAERLSRERVRNEVGGASSTDLLNAQVSYNNDQALFLDQRLAVTLAREDLNLALGRDPTTEVTVSDKIDIDSLDMSLERIRTLAFKNNSSLKVAEQSRKAAESEVGGAFSNFLPRLNLTADYGYTDRTISTDGRPEDVITESRDGSIGLILSFNIFNGTRDRITYQNARIESENARLALKRAENTLAGLVQEKYETFRQRMELVRLEEENVVAARQNLELQQDRYDIGVTSSIEFRDAQVNLIRARTALVSARYQARIARLEIDQLIGRIVVSD